MNHLVSDFVIRLKNASRARKKDTLLPYSKLNKAIGLTLVKEGFLTSIKEQKDGNKTMLIAEIAYDSRNPVITDVTIISKPSLRIYQPIHKITPMEKKGMTVSIITTSKGVMTTREAEKKGVGGELLFRIW